MANSYIPRSQSLALAWMKTFAGGISADPAVYQLSPADAAAIQGAVDSFAAAHAVATNEATRTKVTVRIKDGARTSAEKICQLYYSLIKPNAGVSDANKIAIGVRPLNRGRTEIKCPATSPLVSVIAATPQCHTLRYSDSMTPDSPAKPFGATQLQLFVALGDGPIRDAAEARYCGAYTKNPVGAKFTHAEDGKLATYFGRWISRRGKTGPWSAPAFMRVAA